MKILIVGGGGREHALAWKLKQSPYAERIFCAPGNAGTAETGENVAIPASDLASLVRFAKENRVDLTVVGPDDPLAAGIVDLFAAEGLRIFGPTEAAARLESSKIFAKKLMYEQGIPTAQAGTFEHSNDALRFCDQLQFPIVIKADGLALGKGVIIASDPAAARSTIDEMMNQGRFGEAGRRVVVEEFLRGTECSLHALVDVADPRLADEMGQTARATAPGIDSCASAVISMNAPSTPPWIAGNKGLPMLSLFAGSLNSNHAAVTTKKTKSI